MICSAGAAEEGSPQGSQSGPSQFESLALAEVQGRLRSFLKQSSRFDPKLVLARIRGSSLWQEQVILHSKVTFSCADQLLL